MTSLYKSCTGGDDWTKFSDTLLQAGDLYEFLFFLFIAFWTLVMVNALNALFVDSIMNYSAKDHSAVIQDKLNRKQEFMAKLAVLYSAMDDDGSGEVSFDEFQRNLSDPRMEAFAESIEIEVDDLDQFFSILSCNGTRKVDMETFVVGCIRLAGQAKAMDMMDLMIRTKGLEESFEKFVGDTDRHFGILRSMARSTQSMISGSLPAAPHAHILFTQPQLSMPTPLQLEPEPEITKREL